MIILQGSFIFLVVLQDSSMKRVFWTVPKRSFANFLFELRRNGAAQYPSKYRSSTLIKLKFFLDTRFQKSTFCETSFASFEVYSAICDPPRERTVCKDLGKSDNKWKDEFYERRKKCHGHIQVADFAEYLLFMRQAVALKNSFATKKG